MKKIKSSHIRLAAWIGVGLWMITIFSLSSLSGPQVEELNVFKLWDKAAHFIAFGAGALVTMLALRLSVNWSWRKLALVSVCAISVFGVLDEWHQLYTPKRSGADPADWLADTLGASAAVAAVACLPTRFRKAAGPGGRCSRIAGIVTGQGSRN